jgi:hypothetical protein
MAVTDSESGRGEARCAIHPTLGATGTCDRCGNFMCEICSQRGSQKFCPTCRQRTGETAFPLRRDTWSVSALWDYCFETFKRDWLMLSVAMLVGMGVSMVANFAGNIAGVVMQVTDSVVVTGALLLITMSIQVVVQGVMGLGMMRVAFDVLEGGGVDIGRLFSQWTKAGRYVVTVLLAGLVLVLPLVLLFFVLGFVGLVAQGVTVADIVSGQVFNAKELALPFALMGTFLVTFIPLMYFSLPLYLLQAELAFNDDVTPVQALRNCYTLARGQRLSLVGVLLITSLVGFVGLLACSVGLLPALALGQLLVAGLYLSLRNGSELE